ncbi:KinB-signaling pathway activation protein [Bacillus sp. M6-12]|uniref:KinB-signaling pathway activation protein n=1 Tax=Bacillus sp. M6-12 TaxID=2054166 RepID=UPI000C75F14E|nr:KinB-signaling pathway activation protein [Bacillus sp. M6-12]PLS15580.1 KinB-signaling pathway activation protein [Bacillus sp. M6-12]
MNSRNLVRLFMTTLFLGGATAGIVGFVARWNEYRSLFASGELGELLMTFFWLVGVGLIFSVISQMGFFAYLTVHRFGLGIFKTAKLWNAVQILLIAFTLFDVVYFRYESFSKGEGIAGYMGWAIVLLAVGLIVAFIKVKQTNKLAFIPALFFMVVVTAVEWVPVLRINDNSWMYFMLLPLLVCNAYQLLILSKLNEKSMKELASKKKK